MAELVKIDPKSIGVGQYQHDVDQTKLKEELDSTVIRCVNSVGININTASKSLLSYVSGIGEKMAENIVAYRSENGPFEDRKQIKKVPRLGEKVFQQAAAFVRIHNGKNPLDNSAVHPEAYSIVEKMAKDLKISVNELIANKEKIALIQPEKYTNETIGILGIKDILKELVKPGLDPRKAAKVFEFDPNVKTIKMPLPMATATIPRIPLPHSKCWKRELPPFRRKRQVNWPNVSSNLYSIWKLP